MRELSVWRQSLVAMQRVGFQFPDEESNSGPCIARQIPNYWATREIPVVASFLPLFGKA